MDQTTPLIRTITMSRMMTPDLTNFSGKIHGGHLLLFFDQVAYACAVQYSSLPIVTLSVDHIFFKEPIQVGDLLVCKALVNYVGTTSMEIGIHVEAENLVSKEKRHTNSCYFTMVALGADGKPTKVPLFTPETDIEKRRWQEAEIRRKQRIEFYQLHYKNHN